MKSIIFAYEHNNNTYYAEGFDEESIRKAIEKKLNLKPDTLTKGRKPDYNKELKEIWNKNNPAMKLFLTKDQTSSRDEIELNKKKQHCLYELDLFIKEDHKFLSGVNDKVVMEPNNEVRLYPNTGHEMCYFSTLPDNNKIYRFPNGAIDAYWYIRNCITTLGISNWTYKKTNIGVLEICDSFIAGFNSPVKVDLNNPNVKLNGKHNLPLNLLYKNELK